MLSLSLRVCDRPPAQSYPSSTSASCFGLQSVYNNLTKQRLLDSRTNDRLRSCSFRTPFFPWPLSCQVAINSRCCQFSSKDTQPPHGRKTLELATETPCRANQAEFQLPLRLSISIVATVGFLSRTAAKSPTSRNICMRFSGVL